MADEDIFMEYTDSPIGSPTKTVLKFNIPRTTLSIEDFVKEKESLLKNPLPSRLKVLKIRQFNRKLSNELTERKKKLSELKEAVDDLNNKLLCQKFEKKHLLDEIKICFSSK